MLFLPSGNSVDVSFDLEIDKSVTQSRVSSLFFSLFIHRIPLTKSNYMYGGCS